MQSNWPRLCWYLEVGVHGGYVNTGTIPLRPLVTVDGEVRVDGQSLSPASQVDQQEVYTVPSHVVVELQALGLVGLHEQRREEVSPVVLTQVIRASIDVQIVA